LRYLNGLRVNSLSIQNNYNNKAVNPLSGKSDFDMFNSDSNINNEIIYNYFLRPLYKSSTEYIKTNIDKKIAFELDFRYYILITFLAIVVIGYLVLWLPFQYSLYDEISRTKKMLNIIPSSILNEIDSVINES